MADQAAKVTCASIVQGPPEYVQVYYRDWYPVLLAKTMSLWNENLDEKTQKLYCFNDGQDLGKSKLNGTEGKAPS